MHIDAEYVVARLEELYRLGAMPDGTHTRLAFSPEDAKGRAAFARRFEALGIPVRTDEAGNLIARLEGDVPELPAIVVGSHLDTVPNGGKYDGALGCVAGLAVCAALKEARHTLRHPLEVVVFTDEEGARFGNGMFGSGAFSGTLQPMSADSPDRSGKPRGQVLSHFGINLADASMAARARDTVHCCLELHVEQGASLYKSGIPVGVVSTIAGVRRYEVTVTGKANHAGSTQMADRRDALVAAAAFIAGIPAAVAKAGDEFTVATVGTIRVAPGSVNIIPGACTFSLEMRDQREETLDVLEGRLFCALAGHCEAGGCRHTVKEVARHAPAPMTPWVQDAMRDACHKLDIPYAMVPSGAFHDAMPLSAAFPTGMIFIPSIGGVSHSPEEHSTPQDIETGCNALLQTVLEIDKRP